VISYPNLINGRTWRASKPLNVPDNATESVSLANHIEDLIQQAVGHGNALDVGHFTLEAFDPDAPWQRQTKPKHTDSGCGAPPSSKTITLTLSNLIYLPKAELSAQLTNRLIRIADLSKPRVLQSPSAATVCLEQTQGHRLRRKLSKPHWLASRMS